MISFAGLRYRNVLAEHGGPVASIQAGQFSVRGRPAVLANATLVPGLTRKGSLTLFGNVDGTGVDRIASVARHKAVSEALERWAFFATVHSERAEEFGFFADSSTTGMSAFPGLVRRQARRSAVLEAVERYSLVAWWEGLAQAQPIETDWPGISAIAIEGPFGGVTVVAYAQTAWGGYVYGHAAEESFGAACERAVTELARHDWVMRGMWLTTVAGKRAEATNIFERRNLFFATEEGHELFQEHIAQRVSQPMPRPEVLCDGAIPGPWEDYATVWRFALRPLSNGYLRGGDHYFFL